MVEAIELIRALWSGEVVTHHGAYYETRKAKLYTRSEHAVPLYISAMVPNSARVAGKYGDGLITVGGETAETYRQMLENFDAGAKEAGKDPDKMPRMIELAADFTDDETKAIATRKNYWAGVSFQLCLLKKFIRPKCPKKTARQSAPTRYDSQSVFPPIPTFT
jgi:coenzyme F420-dependent glucose-6-phosphate dehydrogenase